jgi:DNA-binding NtrC family response regulator
MLVDVVTIPGAGKFPVSSIFGRHGRNNGHVKVPLFPPNTSRLLPDCAAATPLKGTERVHSPDVLRIVVDVTDSVNGSQIDTEEIPPKPELIGESQAIRKVRDLVKRVAPTDAKVLITGETGTGKELTAHDIHNNSKRKNGPFIPVNCAAIPKDTIEDALFGHERGAFTGAAEKKPGLFEAANGGTLFLDEVGELEKGVQTKLARVLEYGTFRRVGGNSEISVDVRVVTATNRDLLQALKKGEITRGLYDRLNVFKIQMPSLREHKEDIFQIAEHMLQRHKFFVPDKIVTSFSPDAIRKLESYDWPGNVRELENVIRRAIVFARGTVIEEDDIALTAGEASEKVIERIDDVAFSDSTVLVNGEPGVGKELVARYLHANSTRSEAPFISVNCATLRPDLAESELFGHDRGAFTGAIQFHKGLFQSANSGTLFLDEVGELPEPVQRKLLRAIQENEIIVMGTNKPIKVNVRIIAATNRDLNSTSENNPFRQDLYHRLSVIPAFIPPLRERKDEIPDLILEFLDEYGTNKKIVGITKDAVEKLIAYDWPGNIRELKIAVERAVILADEGGCIELEHIILDPVEINTAKDLVEKNDTHTVLAKKLNELREYVIRGEEIDDAKLRFLALKCCIVQMYIDSKKSTVTEGGLAEKTKMSRSTLRRICLSFGYESTKAVIDELTSRANIPKDTTSSCVGGNLYKINDIHPVLEKHLNELEEYVIHGEELDDAKLRLIALKYRIVKMLIDKEKVTEVGLAEKTKMVRSTLRNTCMKFGYDSVKVLIEELTKEVYG